MCLDMTLSLSLLSRKPPCLALEVKASFVQGVGAFCLERALNSEGFPAFAAHIINKLLRARASTRSTVEGPRAAALRLCVCDQRERERD